MAVFRDIVPGYRLRPPSEQELAVKVGVHPCRCAMIRLPLSRSCCSLLAPLGFKRRSSVWTSLHASTYPGNVNPLFVVVIVLPALTKQQHYMLPGVLTRPSFLPLRLVQVSREVQKLRDYEAALLRAYQSYLKLLVAAMNQGGAGGAKGASSAPKHHARVAVKCMCQLLVSLPHFNYTWVVL